MLFGEADNDAGRVVSIGTASFCGLCQTDRGRGRPRPLREQSATSTDLRGPRRAPASIESLPKHGTLVYGSFCRLRSGFIADEQGVADDSKGSD